MLTAPPGGEGAEPCLCLSSAKGGGRGAIVLAAPHAKPITHIVLLYSHENHVTVGLIICILQMRFKERFGYLPGCTAEALVMGFVAG